MEDEINPQTQTRVSWANTPDVAGAYLDQLKRADAIDAALAEIETRAARIPERFETEVITPKSEARPAIWDEMEAFSEKALALETLAATRQGTVASPDDLGALMGDIGTSCKSCHSEYRE